MKKIKSPRIPVTRGLKDIYGMDMHVAYQAACENRFSVTHFSRLAVAISNVRAAIAYKNIKDEESEKLIDDAIAVLMQVRQHGDETGEWLIPEESKDIVLNGINKADECLGTLDVSLLQETAARLLREMQLAS